MILAYQVPIIKAVCMCTYKQKEYIPEYTEPCIINSASQY